jgi:hypothetical protein
MTTYRTLLDEQCRVARLPIWGGGSIFFGSIIVCIVLQDPPSAPPIVGIGIFGWAIAAYGFLRAFYGGISCPSCNGNLGQTAFNRRSTLPLSSFPPDVRFCPLCGESLDKEASEPSPRVS